MTQKSPFWFSIRLSHLNACFDKKKWTMQQTGNQFVLNPGRKK
jgi:hypothetical protein